MRRLRLKGWSYQRAGDIFGQDHATVLNALNSLQKDIEVEFPDTFSAWEKFNKFIA